MWSKTIFFFLFSLAFLGVENLHGQKKRNVRDIIMSGNEFYFNDQFSKASEFYYNALMLDSTNIYANYYMAECQRQLFDFKEAEKYYRIVVQKPGNDFPLAAYYFPLMQKYNGDFRKAAANFEKFILTAEDINFPQKSAYIEKAVIEKAGCYFAIRHLENPFGEYEFRNLPEPVNSEYNDYGAGILSHDSLIVFTSGRKSATGGVMNNRYGEYFSDNFRFQHDSAGWQEIQDQDNFAIVNTSLAEGAGSYSHQKNAFYFTGCYEEDSFCKIYVSYRKEGKWLEAEALPSEINQKDSENKQPSVTAGGDTLFFVSNRPGGFGGNDIWMSIFTDDKWATPVNLGSKLNTPYNEVSPFYYRTDDILFFSSDGHEGLGGLDIFMARGGLDSIQIIENLGYPFNSNHDDAYAVLGNKRGYLASNRKDGKGNFDLFQFNITTRLSIIADVTDRVKKEERILRSRVMDRTGGEVYVIREEDQFYYDNLKTEEKSITERIIAAKLQAFASSESLALSPVDQTYYDRLSVNEKNRLDRIARVLYNEGQQDLEEYLDNLPVRETMYAYLNISGRLFVAGTDSPAVRVEIPLIDEKGNTVKITTTNDDGTFKYLNLAKTKKYKILADNIPKKLTEYAKFDVRNVQIEELERKPVQFDFEHIYFDLDEKELRPEAIQVLDELVSLYNQNPRIQIEIYAYTDLSGSDEYNFSLSAERGKAAYNYLVRHQVDRTALVIQAQGKDVETQHPNDSTKRQLTRRVEFKILGTEKPSPISELKTFIIQKEFSVEELAKETGHTEKEIYEFNGAASEVFPAYTPVRLRANEVTRALESLYLP